MVLRAVLMVAGSAFARDCGAVTGRRLACESMPDAAEAPMGSGGSTAGGPTSCAISSSPGSCCDVSSENIAPWRASCSAAAAHTDEAKLSRWSFVQPWLP
eukprot:1742633-Prymnesium_polylepis.1